jgi:hypothetical protein
VPPPPATSSCLVGVEKIFENAFLARDFMLDFNLPSPAALLDVDPMPDPSE